MLLPILGINPLPFAGMLCYNEKVEINYAGVIAHVTGWARYEGQLGQ
jgi:hypothetical protein